MNNEVWKDIKNYEGKFQVSNFGRVRNNKGKLAKKYNCNQNLIARRRYQMKMGVI